MEEIPWDSSPRPQMGALEIVIPSERCPTKWGPELKPEELEGRLTDAEYKAMRDVMQGYRHNGFATAAVISGSLAIVIVVAGLMGGDWWFTWSVGIPWGLCPAVAISMAKARVNKEILNPKRMSLQCHGCFAHKIICPAPSPGTGAVAVGSVALEGAYGALDARSSAAQTELEGKPDGHPVHGRKDRECAPENYGTAELTHSSRGDICEDVVRSMYAHLSNGAKRGDGIIAHNKKVVFVPEDDIPDLVQIYGSKQMGDLRVASKSEDGARRVLRFFSNNGTAVYGSSASSSAA